MVDTGSEIKNKIHDFFADAQLTGRSMFNTLFALATLSGAGCAEKAKVVPLENVLAHPEQYAGQELMCTAYYRVNNTRNALPDTLEEPVRGRDYSHFGHTEYVLFADQACQHPLNVELPSILTVDEKRIAVGVSVREDNGMLEVKIDKGNIRGVDALVSEK